MTQRNHARLTRLETASTPSAGELPVAITLPPDATPAERAAIYEDVARREAAGQTVLLLTLTTDNPLDVLVEHFL